MTMNSSPTPVENTTEMSDTGMGMDANTMMGKAHQIIAQQHNK